MATCAFVAPRVIAAIADGSVAGYPASTSHQQLAGDAQTRWQNALAAYHDALRVQAGVVQGLGNIPVANQWAPLLKPVSHRSPPGKPGRQSADRFADAAAPRSDRAHRGAISRPEPRRRPPRCQPGWTAILTVAFDTPHDAERLRKNPLGVFVHAINWSKELG
jgi:VirB8 protein